MKKKFFAVILCVFLFACLAPAAFAAVPEAPDAPDADSLPGALLANDRAAVLKALEGDLGGSTVIVDLETFNALVLTPATKFDDMYGKMPDPENRVLLSYFEGQKETAGAVEKDNRGFYFAAPKDAYTKSYPVCFAVDLNYVKLNERAPGEFDAILDSALFVREPGFYDFNGSVCTACGTYTDSHIGHTVLPCTVHMTCYYDKNDIAHSAVCLECRRMKCSCYCNLALSSDTCIAVSGSGDFAVAGPVHEKISLSFDKDATVQYLACEEKPAEELTPEVECCVCGESMSIPLSVSFNCGEHYACPDCFAKLAAAELTAHQESLECGHYPCDGREHSTEIFSELCPFDPKHHQCEGETGTHFCMGCGGTYPCEEYNEHADCIVCGGYWCDGREHGMGACG